MIDDAQIDEEIGKILNEGRADIDMEGGASPAPMEEDKGHLVKTASGSTVEKFFQPLVQIKDDAKNFHSNGKYDESIAKYKEGLRILEGLKKKGRKDIPESEFLKREMNLNSNIAIGFKQKQDPSNVAQYATKIINSSLDDPEMRIKALTLRAYAYEELDKLKAARDDWIKVKEMQPTSVDASKCLARIQGAIQKDAAYRIEEGLHPLMTELEEYKKKGNNLYRSKNLEGAIEEFTKGIEIFKNKVDIDAVKAIDNKDKTAIAAQLFTNRSLCFYTLEKHQQAIEDATFVIENIDSRSAKSYFRRGMSEAKIGKRADALKDLEMAAKIEPSNESYKDALKAEMSAGGKKKR